MTLTNFNIILFLLWKKLIYFLVIKCELVYFLVGALNCFESFRQINCDWCIASVYVEVIVHSCYFDFKRMFYTNFFLPLSWTYLSILKKVTATAAAAAAAVTENGPLNYEKTNSFRNTKFGIQIAFSMKMCKMPSSKIRA